MATSSTNRLCDVSEDEVDTVIEDTTPEKKKTQQEDTKTKAALSFFNAKKYKFSRDNKTSFFVNSSCPNKGLFLHISSKLGRIEGSMLVFTKTITLLDRFLGVI